MKKTCPRILIVATALLWVLGAGSRLCLAQDQFNHSNDYFEIHETLSDESDSSYTTVYSILNAEIEFPDSSLTKSKNPGFLGKVFSTFLDRSESAIFFLKVGNQQPLPVFTIVKSARDSEFEQLVGRRRISSPETLKPTDSIDVELSLAMLEATDSSIVQSALGATTTILNVVGSVPAKFIVNAIPADAGAALDNIIKKAGKEGQRNSPRFSIKGEVLARDPKYRIDIYDQPKNNPARKLAATITLSFERLKSIYLPIVPIPDSKKISPYQAMHRSLNGKPHGDGGVSAYDLVRKSDYYALSQSSGYSDYYSYCRNIRHVLMPYSFSEADEYFLFYAFLNDAAGKDSRRSASELACPDGADAEKMRGIGLPPLPVESDDSSSREPQIKAFESIASALARRSGLAALSRGEVIFRQSVGLFSGFSPNESHAIGGDELEELFAGLGSTSTVKLSKFDFNGKGSRGGKARMRVVGTSGTTTRYNVVISLDGDLQLERLSVESGQDIVH